MLHRSSNRTTIVRGGAGGMVGTLAADRGIGCAEIDYEQLRGVESNQQRLFGEV